MFHHIELTNRKLKSLIDTDTIKLGGNKPLKIYGTLSCKSGKRMKKENRVFFKSEEEAIAQGYRPCGHCMRSEYQMWKGKGHNHQICHAEERGISAAARMEISRLLLLNTTKSNQWLEMTESIRA